MFGTRRMAYLLQKEGERKRGRRMAYLVREDDGLFGMRSKRRMAYL